VSVFFTNTLQVSKTSLPVYQLSAHNYKIIIYL